MRGAATSRSRVRTTIGNNAAEIEEYSTKLGENRSPALRERRMDTLDGAIANLATLGTHCSGTSPVVVAGDAIEAAVRLATDALEEERHARRASSEAYLKAITAQFDAWARDIERTVEVLTQFKEGQLQRAEDEVKGAGGLPHRAFQEPAVQRVRSSRS